MPAPDSAIQQKTAAAGLRAEVDALHAQMTAALSKDAASVAQFYTEDARVMGGGQRHAGAEQVKAYWSKIPAGATWKLDIIDIGGGPNDVWLLGRSTLSRTGSPASIVDYLSVLRRGSDGKLRYHIDMYMMAVK
jgi:ketosteroid isomerase-like protein